MNKKKIITLLVLAAVSISVIGGTYAWFTSTSNSNDSFETGGISESDEDIDEGIAINKEVDKEIKIIPGVKNKYEISFTNKSNYDQFIRAKIICKWNTTDNQELDNTKLVLELINQDSSENGEDGKWIKAGDYYYYMGRIKENDKTNYLTKSIMLSNDSGNEYKNKKFDVEVIVDSIQAEGGAYLTWGSEMEESEFDNIASKLKQYISN